MWTILRLIIGISGGALVSAGVFALVTSTGVMTRFADKTHTARYVQRYEDAVCFGAVLFNIFWVFDIKMTAIVKISSEILALMGICQGIFVGCLAVSLAEALNATAIFARRTKITVGLSYIVLFAAIGKGLGSLFQLILLK